MAVKKGLKLYFILLSFIFFFLLLKMVVGVFFELEYWLVFGLVIWGCVIILVIRFGGVCNFVFVSIVVVEFFM